MYASLFEALLNVTNNEGNGEKSKFLKIYLHLQ
jgi:hypothetical protein